MGTMPGFLSSSSGGCTSKYWEPCRFGAHGQPCSCYPHRCFRAAQRIPVGRSSRSPPGVHERHQGRLRGGGRFLRRCLHFRLVHPLEEAADPSPRRSPGNGSLIEKSVARSREAACIWDTQCIAVCSMQLPRERSHECGVKVLVQERNILLV
jgi:hypothetical protein